MGEKSASDIRKIEQRTEIPRELIQHEPDTDSSATDPGSSNNSDSDPEYSE